jgi:hypothetical protein
MDDDSFNWGERIPTFDGQIQNFPTWWKKFSAYATMSRIKSILKEERELHLPEKDVSEIDETDEKGKLACLAVNRNESAMESFSIAFITEKAMNIEVQTSWYCVKSRYASAFITCEDEERYEPIWVIWNPHFNTKSVFRYG